MDVGVRVEFDDAIGDASRDSAAKRVERTQRKTVNREGDRACFVPVWAVCCAREGLWAAVFEVDRDEIASVRF